MRLSKKAEYGLRALVAIARQPSRSWSIHELAAQEHIPIKFLEQILLALRHAGMLSSKRGVGGGYTLVRAADQIRLGDVIGVFDGPLAPVPCSVDRPTEKCTCPDPRTCPVRLTMTQVRKEMAALLESRTIEDMVRLAPGFSPLAFEI
jgi:Rrf2 family protein